MECSLQVQGQQAKALQEMLDRLISTSSDHSLLMKCDGQKLYSHPTVSLLAVYLLQKNEC